MSSLPSSDDAHREKVSDIPLSDCHLVSPSGRRFPSTKGLLAVKCSVFRDFITSYYEHVTDVETRLGHLEIPLRDDSDKDVETLWKHLHGKTQLVDAFEAATYSNQAEAFEPIFSLARMADKYQVEGMGGTNRKRKTQLTLSTCGKEILTIVSSPYCTYSTSSTYYDRKPRLSRI